MDIDPNYLNVFGHILNFMGGIILTVEAFNAKLFIQHLDGDHAVRKRMARIGFESTVNTVLVPILMSALGGICLWILLPGHSFVLALLLAPLTYTTWRLIAKLADVLRGFIERLGPKTRRKKLSGCLGCVGYSVWLLLWMPVYIVASLLYFLLHFGIDLPLRFFSQRIVGELIVLRAMRHLAVQERAQSMWKFSRRTFVGFVLVALGFGYQLIATLLQLP